MAAASPLPETFRADDWPRKVAKRVNSHESRINTLENGGFVTSVSVVTANGVSGTVATPTSTPAITLTLGAITPSSVVTGVISGTTGTFTGLVLTPASIAGGAGLRLPHGAAPTTPTNGDMWTTTAGVFVQVNGVTQGPLAAGGSGTVTSVSVVTANGVSGTVATATTTPAITLTLGAITPSSVAATGTITGSNLSGTNTGDQTITLTGDVTGSGTGSFAATIAADAVTNAKLANVATATFKGRVTAATGDPEDLTGTQATTLLDVATGALKGLLSAADKTKLDGVATGATANSSDAFLLARANHTGTQTAATISDFNSASRAQTEAELLAGTNITITPAGAGATRTLMIAASGGGSTVFTQVEVNLGYPVKRSGKFTIPGAGLTVGKPVQIFLARGPYTGKGTNAGEEEMYAGQINGQVTTTTAISASFAFSSRIGGVIKFNYLVGA